MSGNSDEKHERELLCSCIPLKSSPNEMLPGVLGVLEISGSSTADPEAGTSSSSTDAGGAATSGTTWSVGAKGVADVNVAFWAMPGMMTQTKVSKRVTNSCIFVLRSVDAGVWFTMSV